MNRQTRIVVLVVSLFVFGYVAFGYVLGQAANERAYRSLTVFSEVLQHIHQDYVEEPDLRSVTAGALHGLLEALDPYSSYMSPAEFAEYKAKKAAGAVGESGLALSKRFGYIAVVSVLPGSPAEKAGLQHGDVLESIAGFTTREMSVGQAENLLAGEPGSTVRVSVVRRAATEPLELTLTLARLSPPQLHVERFPMGSDHSGAVTGFLRIPALTAALVAELREQLVQFDRQGVRQLILDLRDCALGENAEAISAARLFLPSGKIASLRGQKFDNREFAADPARVVWPHPMAVLISNSTSGPAEILAAAIAGNQRGQTLGTRSFGSASEQRLLPLEDGAALILTVAKYYTPDGKPILDEGVAPTVEFASSAEETASAATRERRSYQDDPLVRRALEVLQGGTAAAHTVPTGRSQTHAEPTEPPNQEQPPAA
ncbi:MAG: PDZ domain-containing protein [Firmicutes bacterium]|nr:PDZ domain-containing protein [Bacillota bacterium]